MDQTKFRYLLNGLFATLVHYLALRAIMAALPDLDVGWCNIGASFAGLTASFLGNRHIVFKGTAGQAHTQFASYIALYVSLALIQGGLMHLFVERAGMHLNLAFFLCVLFQLTAGFYANKYFIFRR